MRLIGKRSVASVLRWILGVVNVLVVIGIVISIYMAVGFSVSVDADAQLSWRAIRGALGLAFVWLIVNRLRRIFPAVNQGDAFEHANVKRLQGVGLGLIGLELTSYVGNLGRLITEGGGRVAFGVDGQTWLAILVVFMLAEVFRQGAQMRDDARMTV